MISYFSSAKAFERAFKPLFLQEEVIHNLPWGLLRGYENSDSSNRVFMGFKEKQGFIGGLMGDTRAGFWNLFGESKKANRFTLAFLNELVLHQHGGLFLMRKRIAQHFTANLEAEKLGSWEENFSTHCYVLRQIIPPKPCPGKLRLATMTDLGLTLRWFADFNKEVFQIQHNLTRLEKAVKRRIELKRVYLWENPRPTCMVCIDRPTENGLAINYVYTPPDDRGKGYATVCCAAVSQQMLDQGYQFCTLFADTKNPKSNKIYCEIGYQPVETFVTIQYKPKTVLQTDSQ